MMRRVRITRIIWVPSGYHIVRRPASRSSQQHSPPKTPASAHVASKPPQLTESMAQSPRQEIASQETPSLVNPPEALDVLAGVPETEAPETEDRTTPSDPEPGEIASFPDQCNPYQDFLQSLPHYLHSMPAETFVTNAPVEPPPSSPQTSCLPGQRVPVAPPLVPHLIDRPRAPHISPPPEAEHNSNDNHEDDDEAHHPLTEHAWLIPHLRQLTGIRHMLRASAALNPAPLPPTTRISPTLTHTTSSENSHTPFIQPSSSPTEPLESPCHDSTWRKRMRQLLFRLCQAADGRHFAFLTDQPDVEDLFDNGYKVAYKNRDRSTGDGMLARWRKAYSVKSATYQQLPEQDGLPDGVQNAFDTMIRNLIPGVDVFFCDYNLAIEADLPICNHMMEQYRSTDFVLFSCEELIGNDPTTQPYMVSYAAPRYQDGGNTSSQHRIYCKTDAFAFCQSIHAIVVQQEKDALSGGHIRTEVDTYIGEPPVEAAVAEQVINRFVEALPQYNSSVKALKAPQTE
ncbi:hypothetical protein [Vibrio rhizosphaerae]|uniref:hypothetical protein n=1 Tax=Vibrio rhizosphaerae TaxID=398736 RepID=UPI001FE1BEA2|nr:hypothetical protein [Vibrio rhizosphaerae]